MREEIEWNIGYGQSEIEYTIWREMKGTRETGRERKRESQIQRKICVFTASSICVAMQLSYDVCVQ